MTPDERTPDPLDGIVMKLRMGGPNAAEVTTEAADEIERLLAGGCARDQGTTQHCAEAARMATRIELLEGYLRGALNVMKVLGYDPLRPRERVRPTPTEATAEDLASLKLKTPPGPITPQLRALLAEQGWFAPSQQKEQAA